MFIHSDEKIVISCLGNLLETFVCYQNTEPKLLATPELFPTCFTLEKLIFWNSILINVQKAGNVILII